MVSHFLKLKEIVDTLMGPDGCPWDRKQTFESLCEGLREETEEVVSAVEKGDHENLKEELGDLLMIIFLYIGIAEKRGLFDQEGILEGVCEKLIHRHPHVFGEERAETAEEALAIWKRQKRRRIAQKGLVG